MVKRYQSNNEKLQIKGETIQWPKHTKVIMRNCKSKDRQYNGQQKKDQKTNKGLQNITQKTKDRATHNPLNTGGELGCSGRTCLSCFTCGTHQTIVRHNNEPRVNFETVPAPHAAPIVLDKAIVRHSSEIIVNFEPMSIANTTYTQHIDG